MSETFSQFSDKVLIAAAKKQSSSKRYDVVVNDLFSAEEYQIWGGPFYVAEDLANRGLAENCSTQDHTAIRVTGGGFRYIEDFEEKKKASRWHRRFLTYVRDHWIAFVALVVSIVALARGQ